MEEGEYRVWISVGGFDLNLSWRKIERMLQDSGSEVDPEDSESEPEFVEIDPSGRYGRVSKLIIGFFLL